MTIGGVNAVNWIWMAIYAFSMYIVGFFLHMRVTMTRKQVTWFIPAIFLWTLAETYFTCLPSSPFQIIMCNAIELSWLIPTIYLFTDYFAFSLIRFSVISWIANGGALLMLKAYNSEEYLLFSEKQLNDISWQSIAVFALSVVVIIILEYPVMQIISRYRSHFEGVYHVAATFYIIFILTDWIIEVNAASKGRFIMRGPAKVASAVFIVAFVVMIVVMIKRKNLSLQKKQLRNRMAMINSQYDEVVAKNRELHRVRHELNKQAEALRAMKGYVPEKLREDMMDSVAARTGDALAGMSLSGNMMMDTLLEKHYRELKDKDIVLETVLAPVHLEKETEDCIVMIQEEMFEYAKRFEKNGKWVRYSVRRRGTAAFILMEICFEDEGTYKRQRFVDMIGDRLVFRQCFGQTYSLMSRYDGSIDYELDKGSVEVGVMIDV